MTAMRTAGTKAVGVRVVGTRALRRRALRAPCRPPATARIEFRLAPNTWATISLDRYDAVIRGEVVSSVAMDDITLLHEGDAVARISFAPNQAPDSARFGDGRPALRYAFTLPLSLPLRRPSRPLAFALRAVAWASAGAGVAAEIRGTLRTNPADPALANVETDGDPLPCSEATVPAIVLTPELAEIRADGRLYVGGWAVATGRIVTVQVYAGEHQLGSARIGARDDVSFAFPSQRLAREGGFTLAAPLPPDTAMPSRIRIQAIAVTGAICEVSVPARILATHAGAAQAAAPAPLADPRGVLRLHCDEISLGTDGSLTVRGWAVSPAGIAAISASLDNIAAGEAELGLSRTDVGAAFPDLPDADSAGFRLFARPLDAAAGQHVVTVIARSTTGETQRVSRSVTASARKPGAPQAAAPASAAAEPANAPVRAPAAEIPTPAAERGAPPAPPTGSADDFRYHLDGPELANNVATQTVTGRLTLVGWALARNGVADVDVLIDGHRVGAAHYGLARHDVGAAFADWPEAVRSGFTFHVPARSLSDGEHTVALRVNGRHGQALTHSFAITVARSAENLEHAGVRHHIPSAEADLYDDILRRLDWRPRFRLLLDPGPEPDQDALTATLATLAAQAYPQWHLTARADAPAVRLGITALAGRLGVAPERIGFARGGDALAAPEEEPGCFVGLLAPGDVLGADALAEFAVQSGLRREALLLYGDELRTHPVSRLREPYYKPQFSPDLLLSTNYIGRPWVAAAGLLAATGATFASLRKAGDYDLILRLAEQAGERGILAVPHLLCERGDGAPDDAALTAERQALEAAAARRGIPAAVEAGPMRGIWRLRRTVPVAGKVSIIIPTCAAQDYIRACLATLKARTAYRDFEIIAIDNIPAQLADTKAWLRETADKVVEIDEPFNWSRFNNRGAEVADGEFLLFLNDDIEVIEDGWLDAMLEHAVRPEVGIVGARLLYPDGNIQHAGMFLAGPGLARHSFRFAEPDDTANFALAATQRNVIAVTGACMLTRRATFDALGGFDEAHEIINNDLDFCLRAHEAGKLTVYTPYATLIHRELASRAELKDVYDLGQFDRRWRLRFAEGDPYHNPNLSRQHDDHRPNEEPARPVFGGHPLFRAGDIRRILVVKVDHIGDFITALPAIRRLKEHFPQARITVLAGRTAQGFAALDPAIDEILTFDFFHARSALGRRELAADELDALRARLAPYRFDLAIDLRKHLDTRELLRCAGAAITAGFDSMGQFNWLDIALEWEGDRGLASKRYHITDDLLHLVDAVGTAAQADRTGIGAETVTALMAEAKLPAVLSRFLQFPVVCVHAGAGNEMKQWPEAYFSALIDLLIERSGVRVLLIGGPDEVETTQTILASVANRAQTMSVVGEIRLEHLPAVMAGCLLYVGNDSGPKHMAAAIGVPTVGIHSGTVDPVEWAPMGPHALAIARRMSCSPCYLTKLEDCPRALACLRHLEPQAVWRACAAMLARPLAAPRTPGRKKAI